MARFKFCGQEIDWITSLEGKPVPVDPDPVFVIEDDGPDTFLDDMGATIAGRQAKPEEDAGTSPWPLYPTGGPAHGQTNRPSAGWKGVAAMADLHQLHDRLDGVNHPRVKPHNFQITAQAAEEWRRELEAAMDRIAQVAEVLGADVEEMEREANLLAASTTMVSDQRIKAGKGSEIK